MTQEQLKFNPNPLVSFLEKPMAEFTKADILKVIEEFQIEMINFRYMADDGRLHTLNFVIQSLAHADEVLTSGERVDGSSLFPYIEAGFPRPLCRGADPQPALLFLQQGR